MKIPNLIATGALVLLLITANQSQAARDLGEEARMQRVYMQSVVEILRSHAAAIRSLAYRKFKYSDNLVRHAVGLNKIFGVLGPMEVHAAKSAMLNKKSGQPSISEKEFLKMADANLDVLRTLKSDAKRWQRKQKGDLLKNLDLMMKGCDDCHDLLPADTAPDVWKDLRKK